MATVAGASGDTESAAHPVGSTHAHGKTGTMVLGAIGVVFGDIGTSPLYAFRESLAHAATSPSRADVLGILSLLIWALIISVTLKYVVFLMRADNKGEGGTLSLMALAQGAVGRRTTAVFLLGIAGASLFVGDALITPAISVLSAVEGFQVATPVLHDYVQPIALAVLVGLFAVQSRGTGKVASFFGPVMLVWFAVLAGLGIWHLADDLEVLWAVNPYHGIVFITSHAHIGFIVLGAVVLAVTGGEALYADMGHFGRTPIRIAWSVIVLPALMLNYLGQGALVLAHPEAARDPLFLMVGEWGRLAFVVLATVAAIIASQAVITGAYSVAQQAVQLGLLPRLRIRHTSSEQAGQIYMPQVNALLFIGVILLVVMFRTSSAFASAYGIAVTGAMLVDTALGFIVARWLWKWSTQLALAVVVPLITIDVLFLVANLLKFLEGGYLPVTLGGSLMLLMWTWVRGTRIVREKTRRHSVPMTQFVRMLKRSKPHRIQGTAVFMTGDPESAPSALLHNLKHNQVLHKTNILLTIRTSVLPRVPVADQLQIEDLGENVTRIIANVGFMEKPDAQLLLEQARRQGVQYDAMRTSFFLARLHFITGEKKGWLHWQDQLFIGMTKLAADVTDFYHIPSGRVVELGSQISI